MIKPDRSSSTLYIRSLPFAKQVYRLSWLMAMFIEHLFLLITSFLSKETNLGERRGPAIWFAFLHFVRATPLVTYPS